MTDAIPGPLASAPTPCTTDVLVAWLVRHHGFQLPAKAALGAVITAVENAYGMPIRGTRPDGSPWPSEVWNHVGREERGIRAGQMRLDGVLPPAPVRTASAAPAVTADAIVALAREMREAQRAYFRERTQEALAASKRRERQLDDALAAWDSAGARGEA